MLNLYNTTGPKYPTTTTTTNGSGSAGQWSNPANTFSDNGSNASTAYLLDGGGSKVALDNLNVAGFGFAIPSNAVIDGIKLEYEVASSNRWSEANCIIKLMKAGSAVGTNKAGSATVASGVYTYGGSGTELWGTTWTPAEVNASSFGFSGNFDGLTSSPADFQISIDYIRMTVFWHYDNSVAPAEVPIRHLYKVYSNNGTFLANIPNVTSKFGFTDEMNSVGSQIEIEAGVLIDISKSEAYYLTDESGNKLTDESGNYLKTDGQQNPLGVGTSTEPTVLYRNGNRVEVWEFNYYYPNGKLMFSGQINRVGASFSGNSIKMLVNSDGIDLDNFIARGYPATYTNDVSQTSQNASVVVSQDPGKGAGWTRYGQTWTAGVANLGAITLLLNGSADVTISVYNGINGSLLGSITQAVNTSGAAAAIQFAIASLIDTTSGQSYFFAISVGAGQSITVYYSNAAPYAGGQMQTASYAGSSGGGSYSSMSGDLYFITASGTLTTTATYTSQDPTTGMLSPIMIDYNARGGRITERDFGATGLSLTYVFNTNTIVDAIKATKDMSPNGFFYRVDLGTSELDFLEAATEPDVVLIKGRHLNDLDLVLSIENLKNQMLFSGGNTGGGSNLYRVYEDQASISLYGIRLERKSDNRVTLSPTADAIGNSFIAENKDEQNYTKVSISYKTMDISELLPGMTVGFAGFGSFIDSFVLQIARREYSSTIANLDLGMLPPRMNPMIERITRGLIAEQTVANPSAPS